MVHRPGAQRQLSVSIFMKPPVTPVNLCVKRRFLALHLLYRGRGAACCRQSGITARHSGLFMSSLALQEFLFCNSGCTASSPFSLLLPAIPRACRKQVMHVRCTVCLYLSLSAFLSFSSPHYLPLSLSLSLPPSTSLSLSTSLYLCSSSLTSIPTSLTTSPSSFLFLPPSLPLCLSRHLYLPISISVSTSLCLSLPPTIVYLPHHLSCYLILSAFLFPYLPLSIFTSRPLYHSLHLYPIVSP